MNSLRKISQFGIVGLAFLGAATTASAQPNGAISVSPGQITYTYVSPQVSVYAGVQVGNNKTTTVNQDSKNNISSIAQVGANPVANVTQTGSKNNSNIQQAGSNPTALVIQFGK